jgi:hypothetical protein
LIIVMRSLVVALLLLANYLPASAAQFPQGDPGDVDRAVAKLSSGDWRERREAVRELVRLGPGVQMRLDELLDGPLTPELRLRVRDARRQIEPMRRVEPTLLTLDLRDVSAREAFDQVSWQEGAPLPCEPKRLLESVDARVTIRCDRQRYWDSILELCRKAGLLLRCDETGVTLVRSTAKSPPLRQFAVSGLFLVTASGLRSVEGVGPGLRLSVYAEPRAAVLQSEATLRIEEAVDARGRSLLSESAMNSGGASLTNGYSWSAGLSPLALPDSVLARFRGTARVLLAESVQTFDAPGAGSDQTLAGPMPIRFSAGGVAADILRVVRSGDEYWLDLRVATDPGQVDWPALMFSIDSGGLRVFDSVGREIPFISAQHDGRGPVDNIRIRWRARTWAATMPASQPFKFVWRFPAKTVRVDVPFQLRDVTLR